VELSPSKTGVKAYFMTGPMFTTTAKRDDKGIELYAGRRFFCSTGNPLGGAQVAITDCTAAVAFHIIGRPLKRSFPAKGSEEISHALPTGRRIRTNCRPVMTGRETPEISELS
jgi:hypothetical protein